MRWKILFLTFITLPVFAHNCQDHVAYMARDLYQDSDYVMYACAKEKCSLSDFLESIEVSHKDPREGLTGCFALPKRKGHNYYTSFYVLEGSKITPQFTFFGRWLTPRRSIKNPIF